MRIRRKHNSCLNCNATLDSVYDYCPICGQNNNDNNVSFGTLMTDFFSNYFALDSRFTHTFKPFFIKPGYLTDRFNEGKRMSYANPVRLYLIISLFFFFIFSIVGKQIANQGDNEIVKTTESDSTKAPIITSVKGLSELTNNESITAEDLEELRKTVGETGYKAIIDNLPEDERQEIAEKIGTDEAIDLGIIVADTVESDSTSGGGSIPIVSFDTGENGEDGYFFSKFDWDIYNAIKADREYNEQQVFDTVSLGTAGDFENHIMKQVIRAERDGQEVFIGYALKNLPLMMFLLLPIFALILKLLYVRRKVLYIKHLIHALHLHSFAYFTYGITLLISFYLITDEDISSFINIASFFLVSTYAYMSFLRVYKQHWFKTLIKFNIQGFVYFVLLFTFFMGELIISFLLY